LISDEGEAEADVQTFPVGLPADSDGAVPILPNQGESGSLNAMYEDEIIAEVWRNRDAYVKEHQHDVKETVEDLRRWEKEHPGRGGRGGVTSSLFII
jgi:hypothetical protein